MNALMWSRSLFIGLCIFARLGIRGRLARMRLTGSMPFAQMHTMQHVLTPDEIEKRAERLGVSMAVACERAGIALSTFYRWKTGATEANARRLSEVV